MREPQADAVDLFAGAGGWDLPARDRGLRVLGIELDDAACATRAAAGLPTLQADVAHLDPLEVVPRGTGVIASPPCPTFSHAGRGGGRALLELLACCLRDLAAGRDTRAAAREQAYLILEPILWQAERARAKRAGRAPDRARSQRQARHDAAVSLLCVEPLRWALALDAAWVALEQVPPVLPIWQAIEATLRDRGHSTWSGILEAERYGVPQTRERAILIARRDGQPAHPPAPTHQGYVKGEPARASDDLFGGLQPWVSMAEALGWGMTERPTHTVTAGGTSSGGGVEVFGSSDVRNVIARERARGAWVEVVDTGNTRSGTRDHGRTRSGDEPAPLITTRADQLERRIYDGRGQRDGRTGKRNPPRAIDEPAPTIAAQSRNDSWRDTPGWSERRPATTVTADERVLGPHSGSRGHLQSHNAVRVTVEEAATLQTFPPGYPWQGTRSAQFRQIGNAIPPRLATHVLQAVAP